MAGCKDDYAAVLAHYEAGLKTLEAGKPTSTAFLAALLRRDQVAVALAEEPGSPQALEQLVDLDRRLRASAPRLPDADWDAWRCAINPPPDRWWWRLDQAQATAAGKRNLLWVILAGLLMTITLSLGVEIIRRAWGGGAGPLSVFSTILTLALTSSPLTDRGRELAGWLMDKARLPSRYREQTMVGAACLAFVATLLLRQALPTLAIAFNNRGIALMNTDDLIGAQRALQRATSLDPDYAAGYYNLANIYMRTGDYDQARALYVQALAADPALDTACNGLGYVLILQEEPEAAIPILYAGLSQAQDDTIRVALWTNLGRAYLEAEQHDEAETALAQALALDPKAAAAHCTLALTAEALEHPRDEVTLHWETCLGYADLTTPRGQELATIARSHLRSLQEER